jgi:hypothetical protein
MCLSRLHRFLICFPYITSYCENNNSESEDQHTLYQVQLVATLESCATVTGCTAVL